jgi:hypothetical protein
LAYTVEDAIAAVGSAQAAEQQSSTFWYVLASVTITDTEPGQLFAHPDPDFPTHITDEGTVELVDEEAWTPITGQGPLFREPLFGPTVDSLGDLFSWAWDGYGKVTVRRGAAGAPFLLGLSIEPVITLGRLSIRPPAFARSFVQRLDILRRNHYRGLLALQGQPQFTAALIEDPVNPKLTGTITPSPTVPGVIHPPASIEIILESLGSFTIG